MDGRLTRREILKGMVATAGLPCLGEGGESLARSGQETSAPPPTASRPGDDLLVAPSGWLGPVPAPPTPGPEYAPPVKLASPSTGAPLIYEHTPEASPDETFFLVGDRLTPELFVWGRTGSGEPGQQKVKIQFVHAQGLAATLHEFADDGPFLVWAGNASGWSRPIRLNVPQPWWCGPDVASPGDSVRIFGRNLARQPEYLAAFVYLALPGQLGVWLNAEQTSKYSLTVRLPAQLKPGTYETWVHAGRGGAFGWGGPVRLKVQARGTVESSRQARVAPPLGGREADLQGLLDQQSRRGGGTVLLGEGIFPFHGTLRVPKGVTLAGSGRDKTKLQLIQDAAAHFGPGDRDVAAVWLAGDGASIEHLAVSGTTEVNLGVAVKSPEPLAWLSGCRIENVRISGIERKWTRKRSFRENCGVRLFKAAYAVVRDSELWGRVPLYLSGVRQCCFIGNELVPLAMYDGNAEAAIMGHTEVIEECIIEGNRVASPPGFGAGSPTTRRMIWLSTGRGSVSHNWVAGNGVKEPAGPGASTGAGQARFGGVAGTDQNVGETILLEGNQRTMFFGKLAGADSVSVVLPGTLPPTPGNRMGSMIDGKDEGPRALLAHDSDGNETPFWPPDRDMGGEEPPIHEYYVSVFAGTGQGETRRVLRREGNRLIVDRPWNEPPAAGSLVVIGTGFYQNLIVGNYVPDGMSGIQLWLSSVENVIANNTIARQRKEGIFLFASATTLASSMPRSFNRGIAPLFWNIAEGNRTEECYAGIIVVSGDDPRLPVEFPRALGNVIRHNSFVRNREDGVTLSAHSSRTAPGTQDTSPTVAGTLVEFNVVRDAAIAYHAAFGNDDAVFRRNHAYFWYPVNNSRDLPVAFQVDTPGTTVVFDANNAEGKVGTEGENLIELKKTK